MTALIQNFSVPAGNDITVTLQVDPALGLDSLDGTLYWRAYQQAIGVPDFFPTPWWALPQPPESPSPLPSPPAPPLIEKSSDDGSVSSGSPLDVRIQLASADTAGLLHNYYHETTLVDGRGNISTINCGIMTVTEVMYR